MTVLPPDKPVTTPEELIVPTVVLLLLHVPPGVASLRTVVRPWHTAALPVIGAIGITFTVVVV
jgi:hypothetical protein